MKRLTYKAQHLADQVKTKRKTALKTLLSDQLPPRFVLEEQDDNLEISGPGLDRERIQNSDLRDIAFLMRSVR